MKRNLLSFHEAECIERQDESQVAKQRRVFRPFGNRATRARERRVSYG